MIVINALRATAVVIKRDGHQVVLVKMGPGRLVTQRLAESQFRAEWTELDAPLQDYVQRFLDHGRSFGASQEALRGLERLQQRDQWVVANLF
jgi:hypothetical protein